MTTLRYHDSHSIDEKLIVVVCPRTTLALSGKLPPVSEFKKSGIRVCLGTDGRGSNPDLSIRAEAACLIDSGLATPQEALSMISVNGAWALGFEIERGASLLDGLLTL